MPSFPFPSEMGVWEGKVPTVSLRQVVVVLRHTKLTATVLCSYHIAVQGRRLSHGCMGHVPQTQHGTRMSPPLKAPSRPQQPPPGLGLGFPGSQRIKVAFLQPWLQTSRLQVVGSPFSKAASVWTSFQNHLPTSFCSWHPWQGGDRASGTATSTGLCGHPVSWCDPGRPTVYHGMMLCAAFTWPLLKSTQPRFKKHSLGVLVRFGILSITTSSWVRRCAPNNHCCAQVVS